MTENRKKIDELSFEEALAELETIVRRLEQGQTALDQAVGDYEYGMQLQQHCEKKLKSARLKVDKVTVNDAGEMESQPLSFDDE